MIIYYLSFIFYLRQKAKQANANELVGECEDAIKRLEEQVALTDDQASRDSRASRNILQEPLRMCATCRTWEPRCSRAVLEPACT